MNDHTKKKSPTKPINTSFVGLLENKTETIRSSYITLNLELSQRYLSQ